MYQVLLSVLCPTLLSLPPSFSLFLYQSSASTYLTNYLSIYPSMSPIHLPIYLSFRIHQSPTRFISHFPWPSFSFARAGRHPPLAPWSGRARGGGGRPHRRVDLGATGSGSLSADGGGEGGAGGAEWQVRGRHLAGWRSCRCRVGRSGFALGMRERAGRLLGTLFRLWYRRGNKEVNK